jgi:hypothetical protein
MMFSWLRRRRGHDGLFRYLDGEKTIYADPIQIWYALLNDPELRMDEHVPALDSADPTECREATVICTNAARRVFGLAPVTRDGKGVSDLDALDVLSDYVSFCSALKKNGRVWPTLFQVATPDFSLSSSPPASAEEPSSASS